MAGNLGLPNRSLQPMLEARAKLAGAISGLRPKWLFAPYWVRVCIPDHVAAIELIEAARFWAKLTKTDLPGEPHHPARVFHYYCVHLRVVEKPAFVLDISQQWETKLAALACYQSQFVTGRPQDPPTFLDRMRDQAAYWGWTIGTRYGEPFACRETVGLASPTRFGLSGLFCCRRSASRPHECPLSPPARPGGALRLFSARASGRYCGGAVTRPSCPIRHRLLSLSLLALCSTGRIRRLAWRAHVRFCR